MASGGLKHEATGWEKVRVDCLQANQNRCGSLFPSPGKAKDAAGSDVGEQDQRDDNAETALWADCAVHPLLIPQALLNWGQCGSWSDRPMTPAETQASIDLVFRTGPRNQARVQAIRLCGSGRPAKTVTPRAGQTNSSTAVSKFIASEEFGGLDMFGSDLNDEGLERAGSQGQRGARLPVCQMQRASEAGLRIQPQCEQQSSEEMHDADALSGPSHPFCTACYLLTLLSFFSP